VAKTLHIK